jgi:hypothetical protein
MRDEIKFVDLCWRMLAQGRRLRTINTVQKNLKNKALAWLLHHTPTGPAVAALALTTILAGSAPAANLVINGSFDDLLVPGFSAEIGDRFPSQQLTGWSSGGYNFVLTPGSADTTGATGEYGSLKLWGPGNGENNGMGPTSPDGGNYVALDGAFAQGPIQQVVNGLTPGKATTVSFWFAGAQQNGYTGPTTEQFAVSLGSSTQFTAILNNVSHGFTGWQRESFTFIPTSASEVLSFLAIGTPGGEPPFSLLDGVTTDSAPEPTTWALAILSFGALTVLLWIRRKRAGSAQNESSAN